MARGESHDLAPAVAEIGIARDEERSDTLLDEARKTQLPPPAQFIKTKGGNGTDQCESGCERKEQGQEVILRQLGQHTSNNWIDDAEKDDVSWDCPEVFDAYGQRLLEICHSDFPDYWKGLAGARADRHLQVGHGYASVNCAFTRAACRVPPRHGRAAIRPPHPIQTIRSLLSWR
jgi:hypothetical protein